MTRHTTIAVVGAGFVALVVVGGLLAQQPATSRTEEPLPPPIKALLEARVATARDVFEAELSRYEHTLTLFPEETSLWSRRWMEAQLRLTRKPADALDVIQAHLDRVRRLEAIAENYAKTGQGRTSDALKTRYFRLEAEQALAEAHAARPDIPLPTPKAIEPKRDPAPSPPAPA